MASEQMPNDDELLHIYDIAYRDDIPVWHSEVQAIRAVYEAGVAAERERAARIAETKQLHPLDEARLLVERPDFVGGYRDSGLDIAAAIREGE